MILDRRHSLSFRSIHMLLICSLRTLSSGIPDLRSNMLSVADGLAASEYFHFQNDTTEYGLEVEVGGVFNYQDLVF